MDGGYPSNVTGSMGWVGMGVGSDTHREIPAEFKAVRRRLVDGETGSVENVDSGWEEEARLRFRLVVGWEEESKVDVVGDETREAGNVANESKPKEELEDNL